MKQLPCALPTRPWPGRARCGTAGALLRLLAFLAFLALLAHPAPARAATPPLLLTHERPQLNAWDTITLQADPTDALSAEDMLRRLDQFEPPARRGGSLGVHKAAMWLHIPLLAPKALPTPWVIDIGYSSLQADIYLARGGRVLQQVRSGQLGAGDLAIRTPAMAFQLEPGQAYDLLVRVRATGPLILPITLGEMPRQIHQALREQMLQGLLNGLAFCLLAYSLVQWVTQREHLFGFYALVVLGSAGFSLQFFGIGDQFLWPGNLWMARYGGLTAGLVALAGSFLFLGAALADAAPRSRYARTMRAGAAITALVCAGVVLGGVSVPIAIAYMSLVSPLPSLLSVPAALVHVRRGNPIGSTLLLAWVAYGVAAAVMVCLVQGWVPANFWTVHSFQFGATLDMLLFMRVLGLRTKALRIEALHASRERDAMRSLAHTDPLTGLPNRRGLNIALTSALHHCGPDRLLAVYVMDLDGFKPVNDTHGHDVGDELLVAVTRRLQSQVRQSDVVARLGGDEFVVMTGQLGSPQQAHDLGNKLLDAFRTPFSLGDLKIEVGLTIGYAISPHDSNDAVGLLKLADAAMYSGKQGGKFCVRRNTGDLALSSA